MALSGTVNTGSYEGRYVSLTWTATQDIVKNTSTIKWTLKGAGNAEASWYKAGPFQVTINGQTTTIDERITLYVGTVVATGSVTIPHNADGSKSFSISVKAAIYSGSYNKSGSGTFTLNTIPRTSTFTRSGTATMGNAQTITITRAASAFTHKLYYTWGGTKTLIASNVGTSYTWTPPVSMAAKIPNAASAACTLTCETYSGSTLIGTKTLSFTLSVPSSVKPTVSTLTLTEAVSGLSDQFGGFVNTKSKIKYAVTAAGAQGSTIKAYAVSIAGQKFSKQTATTAAINAGAGTKTATVTVTDSRGRTASKSVNFDVLAYSPPAFKLISADRCDANGVLDDEGTFVSFAVDVSISPVNDKNTALYILEYKLATEADSEYKELERTTGAYTLSGSGVIPDVEFSTDVSYILRFSAIDYFTTTSPATKTVVITTAKPTFDVYRNGNGFGIGKVAELEGVCDIGYLTRLYGGFMPIEIPTGTDLNTLLTPNIYRSLSAAGDGTTSFYVNCPIATAQSFVIEVLPNGTNAVMQRFSICSKEYGGTFERHYYGGAWGAWYRTFIKNGVTLWSGAYYMSAEQAITLPEAVLDQPTGIELIFSPYTDGAAENNNFSHFFVSKRSIAAASGIGRIFTMHRFGMNYTAQKYLYISNTTITGHANNALATETTGTNGMKYRNNAFVLRYVIGV